MAKLQRASKYFGACVAKSLAAAGMTGTVSVFDVRNGPIHVLALGLLITTALPAGANTLKFTHTVPGGSAVDLCAVTDLASGGVGQFYLVDGVKATALVKTTDVGVGVGGATHAPFMLGIGTIKMVFSAGPPASGFGQVFLTYQPAGSFTDLAIL